MKLHIQKSITLTELLIVIVLLGIISGFAIVDYTLSLERAHERTGRDDLTLIHAAQKLYYSRYDSYWPPDGSTYYINEINENLKLSVMENDKRYRCIGTDGSGFQCAVDREPWLGGWYMVLVNQEDISDTNPWCFTKCPTDQNWP